MHVWQRFWFVRLNSHLNKTLHYFNKQKKRKKLICLHFQHTIKFIRRFTRLVFFFYGFRSNEWKITPSNEAIGLQQSLECGRSSIHFLSSLILLQIRKTLWFVLTSRCHEITSRISMCAIHLSATRSFWNYLLAGTHFQSYFPLLLWYISMENLYILERNKNKLKKSFDILRYREGENIFSTVI